MPRYGLKLIVRPAHVAARAPTLLNIRTIDADWLTNRAKQSLWRKFDSQIPRLSIWAYEVLPTKSFFYEFCQNVCKADRICL
jgi:hypothetical protein